MTADRDDELDEDFLDSLARMRPCDISRRRSHQLRLRCHAILQPEPLPQRLPWTMAAASLRRFIVPALGGAWCLAYLVEIVRCAGAIYGYFGAD